MKKIRLILILGIWNTILPFLGFPYAWKSILFSLSGLILLYVGYVFYTVAKRAEPKTDFDSFSENNDFIEN